MPDRSVNLVEIKNIVRFIAGFESGDFSKKLEKSMNSCLNPIIDKLNQVSQTLKAQAQAQAQDIDKIKFLDIVLSSVPFLVSYLDKDLNYHYVNDSYERWFGVTREQCLKSNMSSVLGKPAVAKARKYLDLVLQGHPQEFQTDVPFKVGGTKTIHFKYRPDFDEEKKVRGVVVIAEDVTPIVSRENKFQEIYQNSPLGIIELDENFNIINSNHAYQNLLGYSEVELVGKSVLELTHPDDRIISKFQTESITISGILDRFEKRYITKSGKIILVRITSRSLLSSLGKSKYISIVENITSIKQSIIESDIILQTMFEGLVIQGQNAEIQRFNLSALKILGLSEDELLGRTSIDVRWKSTKEDGSPYPGDEHPAIVALRTNTPVRNNVMGITLPSGEKRWIKINAIPYESIDQRKVVCTFSDITKITESNRDINYIFKNTFDLIFIAGFDGMFKKISPSFEKLLGWSEAELLCKPFMDFIHPDDAQVSKKEVEKLLAGKNTINFEIRFLTKSGDYLLISWICEPNQSSGFLYGSGRDVTKLRKGEIRNQEILNAIGLHAAVSICSRWYII